MVLASWPIPKTYPISSTAVYISELTDDALTKGPGEREKSGEEGKSTQDLEVFAQQSLSLGNSEAKKRKTYKRSTPVVYSQVRRSDILKLGNNGFKSTDCSSKKCTACNPLTLSTKVIRNLGVQFCSMNPKDLSEENLLQGGGKQEPVARKKGRTRMNKGSRKGQEEDKTGDGNAMGSP